MYFYLLNEKNLNIFGYKARVDKEAFNNYINNEFVLSVEDEELVMHKEH